MKRFMLALCLINFSHLAHAEKDRGGGDEYSIAFIKVADEVLSWAWSANNLPVAPEQLAKVIAETTVESTTQPLVVNGASKDAVNYPKLKKIILSRQAWDRIAARSERNVLVYHEYLSLLGVNDERYTYSKEILKGWFGDYTSCNQLPRSQQSVFAKLNDYLATGTERDATLYVGALAQYRSDIEEFGDKSDPNHGNRYSVAIYESQSSYLCTDVSRFEKRVKAGELAAVKLLLYYSAISRGDDGASAEGLGDLQDYAREHFPQEISRIQKKEASFFAKHPIVWISEL